MKFIKSFFKRFIDEYLKDVLIYSFLFLCIYSVILFVFGYYNKSFIWTTDGLSQHFITLRYFRSILVNFFETGKFNTFIWNLGYGLDMFANLAYYSFGDFIAYLSVRVSNANLESFYNLALGLRLWTIGIGFILYCRYKKIDGIGVILGALIYTFCARMYILNFFHPYMCNVAAIFPLLLIGIERSIKDNKNIFLVFISVITFLQGFYFAYMMFIVASLYGIIFAFCTYKKKVHIALLMLLKTLILGFIAMGLSAFILYPSIMHFLDSTRTNDVREYVYNVEYYHKVMSSFTSANGHINCFIGLSPIFLIGVANYFKEKKDLSMILISLFLLIGLAIPEVGSFLVGFSFPLNRWTFMLCFYFSYMTAAVINKEFVLNYSRIKYLFILILLYSLGLILVEGEVWLTEIVNIFVLSYIVLLYLSNKRELRFRLLRNIMCVLAVSFGLAYSVYFYFSPMGRSKVEVYTVNNMFHEIISTNNYYSSDFEEALNYIKENENGYYLVGKYPNLFETHNMSLYMGFNSINYYYSINSNLYSELSKDLEDREYNVSYEIGEFNSRARITTLLGNKYYISSTSKYLPYGYKLIKKYSDDTYLYKNEYSLPFAVLYTDYIDIEKFNELKSYEKEIVMLKTTALDKERNVRKFDDYKKYVKKDYKVLKNKIYLGKKKIKNNIKVLNTDKDYLTIKTDSIKNREIYVRISGIKFDELSENEKLSLDLKTYDNISADKWRFSNKWIHKAKAYKISAKSSGRTVGESFRDDSATYYYEDDVMFVNLGYFEKYNGEIKLTFNQVGNYSFDKLEVVAVSYDNYKRDIKDLKRSNFKYVDHGAGYFKCTIEPTRSGIIQFNTNYSKGWNVYVDGTKVDTFKSNKYFLGIEIEKGYHEVELRYETPYLRDGINISKKSLSIFELFISLDMLFKFSYFKLKHRK